MAQVAKVTSDGWEQWEDSVAVAQVTADGWSQVSAAAAGGGITVVQVERGRSVGRGILRGV